MSRDRSCTFPRYLMLTDGRIDLDRRTIERSGRATARLSCLEHRLAYTLATAPQPLPAATLRERVWGQRTAVSNQAVQQLVRRLRRKIEPNPVRPIHLRFEGVGYAWFEADAPSRRLLLQDGWVDLDSGQVRRARREAWLTALEQRLIGKLASSSAPVPVRQLLVEVWGYHPVSRSRAPYVSIQRLRQKLEVDPRRPRHLVCEARRGYRFVPVGDEPTRPLEELVLACVSSLAEQGKLDVVASALRASG